jgi:hypothetical protein
VTLRQEEDPTPSVDRKDDRSGSDLYARLMILGSSPLFRFAFRAAIPIAIVVAAAILVSH